MTKANKSKGHYYSLFIEYIANQKLLIKQNNKAVGVIVLLHLIYFIAALLLNNIYTVDTDEYLYAAENMASSGVNYGGLLSDPINLNLYSLRPPGYSVFILLSNLIHSGSVPIIILQNILSIIILIIIYIKLGKASGVKSRTGLFFLCLVFFPVYLIMVNMIMADILLTFVLTLSWFYLEKYLTTTKLKFLVIFNLLLCISVMVKPVMMYFWVPNILLSVFLVWKSGKIYPVLLALLLPATIVSWSYRNYNLTGYYHFSSIKMQNLLEINAGAILSDNESHDYMMEYIRSTIKESDSIEVYKEKSEFLLNKAKVILKESPVQYIKLHIKGMINFMVAPGKGDLETFFNLDIKKPICLSYEINKRGLVNGLKYYMDNVNPILIVSVILIGIWNVISLILMLIAFFSKDIDKTVRTFLFILILYMVFACGPGGYARFKSSLYPFMIFLLPFGWNILSLKVKNIRNQILKNNIQGQS